MHMAKRGRIATRRHCEGSLLSEVEKTVLPQMASVSQPFGKWQTVVESETEREGGVDLECVVCHIEMCLNCCKMITSVRKLT